MAKPREPAHPLVEGDPRSMRGLGLVPMLEHLVEALAIQFDPFSSGVAADEAGAGGLDLLPLAGGQLLAIEREVGIEGKHRVDPNAAGGARVDGDRKLRARGAAAFPPVGQFYNEAALLEQRDLADEAVGIAGSPGERLEEPAGLDQLAHERALLRGGAHGLKEGIRARPDPFSRSNPVQGSGRAGCAGPGRRRKGGRCKWRGRRRGIVRGVCSRRDET